MTDILTMKWMTGILTMKWMTGIFRNSLTSVLSRYGLTIHYLSTRAARRPCYLVHITFDTSLELLTVLLYLLQLEDSQPKNHPG